jgi:hypothetical protein
VGVDGLAEAGRIEQLPILNLKSSTAISPVKPVPRIPSMMI